MNANLKLELDKDTLREIVEQVIDAKEQSKVMTDSLLHERYNPNSKNHQLLSIDDMCKVFKVSRVTIHTWKKEGRIPYFKVSRRVYFDYDEVIKSLQKYDLSSVQNFNKARRTN